MITMIRMTDQPACGIVAASGNGVTAWVELDTVDVGGVTLDNIVMMVMIVMIINIKRSDPGYYCHVLG